MGIVLPFKKKIIDKEIINYEPKLDKERLERIKKSIEIINKLMVELKQQDKERDKI